MTVEIVSYAPDNEAVWDKFCAGSVNGTFLHSRRFLSYHGERFIDASALIFESGRLVGVFPAAVTVADPALVVSHPGATYGGIVHGGWLRGTRIIDALTGLCVHYRNAGYQRLFYKAIPYTYAKVPAQDDSYALSRLGAQRVRCDLSSTIDLANRQTPSGRRRRGLKKAQKVVTLSTDPTLLGELWAVVANNLSRKHDAHAVHTLDELTLLMERFPAQIIVSCALLEGSVEAGVVFFNAAHVWHSQYIAASERGYETCALDAVFDAAISEARTVGARYFDFGTSNENRGKVLNEGLYRFKSEFGGGGVAHETWEISLQK